MQASVFLDWAYLYPHADRDFYQIFAKFDWYTYRQQLFHQQIGSDNTNLHLQIGPVALMAGIGAFIGARGGPWGALAGAIIGEILGAIVGYGIVHNYVDEAGTI
ncbi:MAG TPA: hypothetical protein VFE98_05175 [Candidatus Bathyarchaeia archaeon]|nr:hypothetical protein [Candidatus Bathyarchaeia archaeon]